MNKTTKKLIYKKVTGTKQRKPSTEDLNNVYVYRPVMLKLEGEEEKPSYIIPYTKRPKGSYVLFDLENLNTGHNKIIKTSHIETIQQLWLKPQE